MALSIIGLALMWWAILIAWAASSVDTGKNGLFTQVRVGRNGRLFRVLKIRTMRDTSNVQTTVTTNRDARITKLGGFFRKTKLDELPQLINILLGDMSFVGPRPDVPGFADKLESDDRLVLSVRPGVTGPATLKYRHEEQLLADQENPERYNKDVIYPDKVRINLDYVRSYTFCNDLKYIWQTLAGR